MCSLAMPSTYGRCSKGTDSASTGGGSEIVRRSARQSVAPQKPYVDPDEVYVTTTQAAIFF